MQISTKYIKYPPTTSLKFFLIANIFIYFLFCSCCYQNVPANLFVSLWERERERDINRLFQTWLKYKSVEKLNPTTPRIQRSSIDREEKSRNYSVNDYLVFYLLFEQTIKKKKKKRTTLIKSYIIVIYMLIL